MKPDNSRDGDVFRFSRLRIAGSLVIVGIAIALWITLHSTLARSSTGEFKFNGMSIQEFHCFPTGIGRHPAVILIHGAGYRGLNYDAFDSMCGALADHG